MMKISRLFGLLSCVVAVALLLLSLQTIAIPCDEACGDDAPTCQCICCYGKVLAVPASAVLPDMNVSQYAMQFESLHRSILLATDIFRPPIA